MASCKAAGRPRAFPLGERRRSRRKQMKKTFVAAAVLGAFAGAAFAAPSVTLYGVIDTGVSYTHYNPDTSADSTDTFQMKSGQASGSRWGLRGTEDLGNGVKVGFDLESGMNTDDGTNTLNRLFGREASVFVSGSYGTVYAGRLGKLISTAGSIAMGGIYSPFGTTYGDAGVSNFTGTAWDRTDNTIAYKSPSFNGFTAAAEYSFSTDSTGVENKASAERYASVGLQYKNGPLQAGILADWTLWKNTGATKTTDDGYSVIAGGNYKFSCATVYAQANYFSNQANVKTGVGSLINSGKHAATAANEGYEGWGVSVGAKIPAFGGNVLAQVGYRDTESVKGDEEYKRWGAALGYTYAFSKRTSVYGAATYAQEKSEKNDVTPSAVSAMAGLIHKF